MVAATSRMSAFAARSADLDHLTRFEHAQELGLRGERHVPDLVEEERAAVGVGDAPLLVGECAREGALHMAEELALDEPFRERGAVHSDEVLLAPLAVRVDRGAR